MSNGLQTDKSTEKPKTSASRAAPAKAGSVIAEGFRTHTRGETLFNRLTYMGVGYFGVTGVSVFLTWLLRDSKAMSPGFEKFTEKLVESTKKSPIKGLSGFIYSNMTILTLFLGGSLASVLPVKWLEDNKAKIVKSFDRRIYGKEAVENDPEIMQAHAAMEAMPKQTWGSVAASRLLAFATTLGTSFLLGSEGTPIGRATGRSIDSVSTQLGRGVDGLLHKENAEVQMAIAKANEANFKATHDNGMPFTQHSVMREWKGNIQRLDSQGKLYEAEHVDWKIGTGADRIPSRVFSYIGLDGLYTLVTSATLYAFTRILAPVLGKKNKHPEAAVTVPVASATPVETAPVKEHAPHHAPAEAPQTSVSETTHHARVTHAHAHHEVTA